MSNQKRTSESKRTILPRDVKKADIFLNDCEKLSHSGKHDMNVLKEVMMLLIANDAPLPPEWKDHKLKGQYSGNRECHVKGDLVLVYNLAEGDSNDLITFIRVGTHSEIF